ncbi:MAG: pseudouridine synthase [Actinomycetaceae bacterium]|nr:pseudouridine synthase [Actinomycetaceae bacterium]
MSEPPVSRAKKHKQLPPARAGLHPKRLTEHPAGTPRLNGDLRDWILSRYPSIEADGLDQLFAAGDIVDAHARPWSATAPASVIRRGVWMYRPIPDEPAEPISIPIVQRTNRWLIADKPHGLSIMPRGQYVAQTLTVALRRQERNDDIVTAHRLDLATAGLVLATLQPQYRRPYQQLFAERQVEKLYRVIAPVLPDHPLDPRISASPSSRWLRVRARIHKPPGAMRALFADGEPNSETLIRQIGPARRVNGLDIATYEAKLVTGRTHQIRAHFAGLGAPIVGDSLFEGAEAAPYDRESTGHFTDLQLLAYGLAFTDPVTGESIHAESKRALTLD